MDKRRYIRWSKLALIGVGLSIGLSFAGCDRDDHRAIRAITGGEPERGRVLIRTLGCATCHIVPGVRDVEGLVGPPLERIASRAYLAGRIENTPENMLRWIRFPKSVDPETVMPQIEMTEQDGRDITSYLYTLR